jgi:hypothetical protein
MAKEILTYAQFARCLAVTPAIIRVNVKRGNIIADTDSKLIDAGDARNKLWIDGQIAQGKTWDLNRKNIIVKPGKGSKKKSKAAREYKKPLEKPLENKKEGIPILSESEIKREEFRIKLADLDYQNKIEQLKERQHKNKLNELEIAKKEGALIPFDVVSGFFVKSIETIRTVFSQEMESLANIYVERLGGKEKDLKDIKKELMDRLNFIMIDSKKEMLKGADQIVDEYKEVRGRGEKK